MDVITYPCPNSPLVSIIYVNNKVVMYRYSSNWKGSQSWWRYQMETFPALLAFSAGNSPVIGEFPSQRPVTRSFDVFFDLSLNQRLSKQSCGWWFETRSGSLWRQYNANYWSLDNRKLKSALPGYFWITSSERMHEVTNWFIDDMWWIAVSNLLQKSIYLWWNKWSLIIYH